MGMLDTMAQRRPLTIRKTARNRHAKFLLCIAESGFLDVSFSSLPPSLKSGSR